MLKTLNPLIKLIVCMIWLVASMLIFDARFQMAVILIVGSALVLLNRTSLLVLLALMVPFCLFGFGFLTTSLLFRQESEFALHVANETPFATPALAAGATLFLRAVACGMVSAFFALTTEPGAFVRAMMVQGKLPPRIAYSLFSAIQLIPDLASEAQNIRFARAMNSGRRPRRIPGPIEGFSLVVPLLAFAIRRAGRSAIAMEARGFSSGTPRTVMKTPSFTLQDIGFLITALGLLVSIAAFAIS